MRGRKKLPKGEKKKFITIFVKEKHYAKTKAAIERIRNAVENNKDGGKKRVVGGENNTDE